MTIRRRRYEIGAPQAGSRKKRLKMTEGKEGRKDFMHSPDVLVLALVLLHVPKCTLLFINIPFRCSSPDKTDSQSLTPFPGQFIDLLIRWIVVGAKGRKERQLKGDLKTTL